MFDAFVIFCMIALPLYDHFVNYILISDYISGLFPSIACELLYLCD